MPVSNTVLDQAGLRLAVAASGEVWYARGRGAPRRSRLDAPRFARSLAAHGARRVFLFCDRRHAALAADLYRRRLAGEIDSLAVCPARPHAGPSGPADLVRRLAAFLAGGWREAGPVAAATFRLVAADPADAPAWDRLVRAHPLHPHLSFLEPLGRAAAGRVLAEVLDPGNFADPEFPDSPLPLQRHFGLVPGGGLAASVRRGWLAASWAGGACSARPGAFLSRLAADRGESAASKLFLAYLTAGWRDLASATHRGRLFVPRLFFGDPAVAAAYGPATRA